MPFMRATVQSPRTGQCLSMFLLAIALLSLGGDAQAQTTKAYVASTGADSVAVIDTAGESVVGTVAVGAAPTRVAVSRDGTRAYVLNRNADSVSVIDTATDTNVATIAVGDNPASLAVTPDGRQLYVVLDGGVVQAIDTSHNTVTADIPIESGGGGIAVTPDGASAFVASGGVMVINTATNTIADFFYLEGGNVHAVALSPDGARAYFLTNGNDIFGSDAGVIVLDTRTCAVIRKIVLGALPGQMALAPDGSRVYVGIQNVWVNTGYGAAFIPGRSVAVIDAISTTWVGSIDLGAAGAAWTLQNTAAGIAVAADRSDVYVAVPRLSAVAVINTSTNVVRQLLPVSPGPNGVAVVPDPAATLVPYVVDAVDDNAPLSASSSGGTPVANVLANDRIGGAPVDARARHAAAAIVDRRTHHARGQRRGRGRRRRAERRPRAGVSDLRDRQSSQLRSGERPPHGQRSVSHRRGERQHDIARRENRSRQRARERYARRRPGDARQRESGVGVVDPCQASPSTPPMDPSSRRPALPWGPTRSPTGSARSPIRAIAMSPR